jgi:hypothetical protein
MSFFSFFPIIIMIVYFAIIFGILYLIFKWVNKFISLREEQNGLLREIINRMGDNK